ncbi:MAG: hypothetical protein J2P48_16675 [Alphaproteobacteria bacterium]|nr:hypothetical protein [Alphaproteobacteria bacterium]
MSEREIGQTTRLIAAREAVRAKIEAGESADELTYKAKYEALDKRLNAQFEPRVQAEVIFDDCLSRS